LNWDGVAFSHLSKAIGTTRGFSVIADLKRLGAEVSDESDSMRTDFDNLLLGRLDGIAALALNAKIYLKERPDIAEQVVRLDPPIATKDYYLLLSHSFVTANPNAAEAFWNAVAAARESPEFKYTLRDRE